MPLLSIRSQDFDRASRVDAFRDVVANMTRVDFIPDDQEQFISETSIAVLPGVIIGHGRHSASTAIRTRNHAAECSDDVMFHIPLSGGGTISQTGGEQQVLRPGCVYADPGDVPGTVRFGGHHMEGIYVSIPRAHFTKAAAGLDAVLRRAAPLTPQWRLFLSYVRNLHTELPLLAPEEAAQCVAHVQDLALMALGATREASEIAAGRGVRAARLKEVKREIEQNLLSSGLSADSVASRLGLSSRYIRVLFEREGTSFRDYVASRRLARAFRMLSDPALQHLNIAQIAMEAGFGDLSWFNTRFKQTYGMTPRDVRAGFA
ncbi:AraC family transcriptional regulator (plasmid) [Peteryoungia desertarenae]|uniref:AraC family transcriptional regulator n=1 Tax=Peteryoungia desertarenae TaxID=1813451 RepID=A0ABX6QUI0_9HYPH|nr:AraC family transcriptional regulator [Peteryoungia desertarenae]QLF71865.1 AraC family transcriptional regulator [Peteryoungia desertarenae]